MVLHRNAKLGLAGRFALVGMIEEGCSVKSAAAAFSVSPATACRWSRRWREASAEERRTLTCLLDRSSRPRRMPRLLSAPEQRRICAARRQTGWGPRLLTLRTGHPHSTISKVLRRNGLSRPARVAREPERRYEYHSRFAYTELLDDDRAPTVTAFVERALDAFAGHGIEARRLMTDNAWSYSKNRSLRELLDRRGIRHLTIRPRRPRTNGKVERFHQTMTREWAYGLRYRSSRHRAAALPHWLRHYNERRPHSSLGGLSPISRVHNVRGQDN